MEGAINGLVQGLAVALAQLVLLAIERLPIQPYADTAGNLARVVSLFVNFENVRFWGLDDNHPLYSRILSRLIGTLIRASVSGPPDVVDPGMPLSGSEAELRFVLLVYSLKRKYQMFLKVQDDRTAALLANKRQWSGALARADLLAAKLSLPPELFEGGEPLQLYEQLEFNMRHGGVCGVARSPGAAARELSLFLFSRRSGRATSERELQAKEMHDRLNRGFYLLNLETRPDFPTLLEPLRENMKAFVDSYEQTVVNIQPATSAVRRAWQRHTSDGMLLLTSTTTRLWETSNFHVSLQELAQILNSYAQLVSQLLLDDNPPRLEYAPKPEVAPAERTFFVDEFSVLDGLLKRWALHFSSRLAALLRGPTPEARLAFSLRTEFGQQ